MSNAITRRAALFRIGTSTVAAAGATVPTIIQASVEAENRGRFETPAEYVAAMLAIGWRATAMFHRSDDGTIQRMGVQENAPEDHALKSWPQFQAIQMRVPVQLPIDVHGLNDWWSVVWLYLYENGYRDDVTIRPSNTETRS